MGTCKLLNTRPVAMKEEQENHHKLMMKEENEQKHSEKKPRAVKEA